MPTTAEPDFQPDIAMQYLQGEFAWLNLTLQCEILRLHAAYQLSLDEFRGLYVSDDQVNSYLDSLAANSDCQPQLPSLENEARQQRSHLRASRGLHNPWTRLLRAVPLSQVEQDVIVLAASVEFDLKYASILAYLNNDVTQRWPTVDLALRLFSRDTSRLSAIRQQLRPESRMFSRGILQTLETTRDRPSWRSTGFRLAPCIWDYLIGVPPAEQLSAAVSLQAHITRPWDDVYVSAEARASVKSCSPLFGARLAPVIVLSGRTGCGRRRAVEAMCAETARPLITINAARIDSDGQSLHDVATSTALNCDLFGAVVLLETQGNEDHHLIRSVTDSLRDHALAIFVLAGDTRNQFTWADRRIAFSTPSKMVRTAAWRRALSDQHIEPDTATVNLLAERFNLNAGEITRAARNAIYSEGRSVQDALLESTRCVSLADFGPLARHVPSRFDWNDLILPETARQRLQSIVAAVEHRNRVFEQWGFGRRRIANEGLTILFSGQSGTGKTMAASVVAGRVGFDLFRIDLSAVVSKYIGETEKNLERIFSAAHSDNAILFFDEADALFGKRSEVKDAHDRFANIEIGYLLQKLEAHDGVVILATNLSSNIDDAFSRRVDFSLEFPMPQQSLRQELWRSMFPPEAPLADDVQFDFLAKRFDLAGGDIRNVATNAAFRAAQNGQLIHMAEIVQALDEQLIKQGKVRSAAQFGEYYELLRSTRDRTHDSVNAEK